MPLQHPIWSRQPGFWWTGCQECYLNWEIDLSTLQDGWNSISLDVSDATTSTPAIDLSSVTYFSFYATDSAFEEGESVTVRIDNVRANGDFPETDAIGGNDNDGGSDNDGENINGNVGNVDTGVGLPLTAWGVASLATFVAVIARRRKAK